MVVDVGPVRKPLLVVCDLNDKGHDVHFMASGHAWVEHSETGEITVFQRSGGKYELVARVELPQCELVTTQERPHWRGALP